MFQDAGESVGIYSPVIRYEYAKALTCEEVSVLYTAYHFLMVVHLHYTAEICVGWQPIPLHRVTFFSLYLQS